MSENAEKMQETSRFQKGKSGNPRGKVKGTKNKATVVAETLLKGEIENICRVLIEEALRGNMQAIKMIIDRIIPQRKAPSVFLNLPELNNAADALKAIAIITKAVSSGEISPNEGESLSNLVEVYVKALEIYDFELRLKFIEEK